jgi:hypothetical protein
MAPLASDTENHVALIKAVGWRRKWFEVSAVALQATRNDGLIEVRKAVGIAGTVDPSIGFCPIRNGQFKEFISFPIQVGLPLAPGANHKVEALLVTDCLVRWQLRERRLEKALLGRAHHKK